MIKALYFLFVLSGAAGLIYESIWTRYLGLFVGHSAYAQIIVLVIFLGGMSLGAYLISRWSERLQRTPVRLRGGRVRRRLHRALLSRHLPAVTGWAYQPVYPCAGRLLVLAVAKWVIAGSLILPQSMLLGMTFPLMSAGVLRLRSRRPGRTLSMLYFSNSLGAAVGCWWRGSTWSSWRDCREHCCLRPCSTSWWRPLRLASSWRLAAPGPAKRERTRQLAASDVARLQGTRQTSRSSACCCYRAGYGGRLLPL